MMEGTSQAPEYNPDDYLSLCQLVTKHQRAFAVHFLPKHCTGVKLVQIIGDNMRVVARLKTLARISPKLKDENTFLIPKKDVQDWRKNINLHTFMAGGIK